MDQVLEYSQNNAFINTTTFIYNCIWILSIFSNIKWREVKYTKLTVNLTCKWNDGFI